MEEFKHMWEQCTQKLYLKLSAIIKTDLKDSTEKEQILLDKIETDLNEDLKLDLKMLDYKNDMEKDITLTNEVGRC